MEESELIPVTKDGQYLEVHPTALSGHKAVGWKECEKKADLAKLPSAGLNVEQLKEALAAKNIAIPEGVTKKADLAKLLDESSPAD